MDFNEEVERHIIEGAKTEEEREHKCKACEFMRKVNTFNRF